MIEAGLVASRWFHYAATTVLFGLAAFGLYARRPALSERWARLSLAAAAVAAAASCVAWFYFSTAAMVGDLASVPSNVVTVLTRTDFGPLWAGRTAVALVLCLPWINQRPLPAAIVSGALLASLSLTGHARMHEGALGMLHIASDSLHLLCAGLWLGALAAFVELLWSTPEHPLTARALTDFARTGSWAVAGLALTGLVNGCLVLNAVRDLWSTRYGLLLCLKLGLFAGMMALAASNRFRGAPALAASANKATIASLRRHVAAEQAIGLTVLLIVAVLGTMDPIEGS